MHKHPSHTSQIGKLNRASGQLEAVKLMIEERRYCVDILTQLRAVRNAVKNVEMQVLEKHMQYCLTKTSNDVESNHEEQIGEIMQLLKKYE